MPPRKPQIGTAEWFQREIEEIFGMGAQSAFSRFLALAGAGREHKSILRSISGYANGKTAISSEMIALLVVMRSPAAETREMIREAIDGTRQNYAG